MSLSYTWLSADLDLGGAKDLTFTALFGLTMPHIYTCTSPASSAVSSWRPIDSPRHVEKASPPIPSSPLPHLAILRPAPSPDSGISTKSDASVGDVTVYESCMDEGATPYDWLPRSRGPAALPSDAADAAPQSNG